MKKGVLGLALACVSLAACSSDVSLGGLSASARGMSHCFASPGACGYPDPAYGNVGVLAGTALRPSGSVVITTDGTIVDGLDVTGSIEVHASHVLIRNTRVLVPAPGCGPDVPCGNACVIVELGVTGTVLSHLELTVASGATVEHSVRNLGDATTEGDHLYVHGIDSLWYGAGHLRDSYITTVTAIGTDHVSGVYYGGNDGELEVTHDTLLNPFGATSAVFASKDFGDLVSVTVRDSLLAGGSYTLYGGASGLSTAMLGPVVVTDNRFARCGAGVEVGPGASGEYRCAGGPDASGYYPRSGAYGPTAYFDDAMTTWLGNVWDDDGSAVPAP